MSLLFAKRNKDEEGIQKIPIREAGVVVYCDCFTAEERIKQIIRSSAHHWKAEPFKLNSVGL